MRISLFFILCITTVIYAQVPQAQYKQGCELLGSKIYCFGGAVRDLATGNAQYADSFNNNHYVLDLTNFTSDQDAASLHWQQVPSPANQFTLEARADFAHVKVSDNSYIVFGGAGSNKTYATNPNIRNLTTIYFADSNSWQTIPTGQFPASSILTAQGFGAQATMDVNGSVWLLGGIPPNPQARSFNINTTLLRLDAQNPQWTAFTATPMTPQDSGQYYPTFHHGAVAMRDGYIYSYGGLEYSFAYNGYKNDYDSADSSYKYDISDSGMYEYLIYNKSGNNTVDFTYGYTFPSQRELHTLTVLPNTDTFLLYGGTKGYNILNDYCYIYDTKTSRWSKMNFQGANPGARYGHSAVAYGKDSLFVMFGVNANGQVLNDAYVLNTTTYTWTALPLPTNGTSSDTHTASPVLGGGAIAGIVVGSIAVIAIIAGGGYFLYRRGVFNSTEPTTKFTEPVYGHDAFGDDFARPTDEKFVHQSNSTTGSIQQQAAITNSAAAIPLVSLNNRGANTIDTSRMKPMDPNELASPTETNYTGMPMKPMSDYYSTGGMSSPSTATYVNEPAKPYSNRLSDDTHSTSGLVKPADPSYSNAHVVKPHGFE